MTDQITLLADIGATNARFALSAKNASPKLVQVLQCEDFETAEDAINTYLLGANISKIHNICFAVAGPVLQGAVDVTNNHWVIRSSALKNKYQVNHVSLLNDFEAIAYSVTELSSKQLHSLGGPEATSTHINNFTYAILGAGSGLGVASLIKRENNVYPVVTEGGHASFSPVDELQMAILNFLRKKYEQVSNEQLLSGPGIVNIYQALCEIQSQKVTLHSASQICEAANNSQDEICMNSLDVFFKILGQVAGDLVLTFGAFDGVFIAGGIVQRYQALIENSQFRASFENKSKHHALLAETPSYLITEKNPGLIGANYYANEKLT